MRLWHGRYVSPLFSQQCQNAQRCHRFFSFVCFPERPQQGSSVRFSSDSSHINCVHPFWRRKYTFHSLSWSLPVLCFTVLFDCTSEHFPCFLAQVNTLGPIVTMPFMLTYAAVDYCYFSLAMSFDKRKAREDKYRCVDLKPFQDRGVKMIKLQASQCSLKLEKKHPIRRRSVRDAHLV